VEVVRRPFRVSSPHPSGRTLHPASVPTWFAT
jgi:hypothetical protein